MKTLLACITVLGIFVFSKAQDAQDIAEIACNSTSNIYEFDSTEGYIESLGFPVRYEDSEFCQWYINPAGGIPDGQTIFLEVVFFSTEDCCDSINVYEGQGTGGELITELAGNLLEGAFFSLGSEPVTLNFDSDSSINYRGFRLYFYIGEQSPGQDIAVIACSEDTRPAVLLNGSNILETLNYPADHPEGTECVWIITPEVPVDGMYLSVLSFYAYNYLYIYFDDDVFGDHDAYLYGSYSPGYTLYNPGSVMSLQYEGTYDYPGFQLYYYQVDEACVSGSAPVIEVGEKAELVSPGFPYVIAEHLSCRWLLEAPEGQQVSLTSLEIDLYGNGLDCANEFVEILDGEDVDALSLGIFCGNSTFGTLSSSGQALQVYLRTREESNNPEESRTGFRFEYEAL